MQSNLYYYGPFDGYMPAAAHVVSECLKHTRVHVGEEQRSIKRAFHLTGLSICSMRNLCFQLSHRYPREPGREVEADRRRGDRAEEGGERSHCNEETATPRSRFEGGQNMKCGELRKTNK